MPDPDHNAPSTLGQVIEVLLSALSKRDVPAVLILPSDDIAGRLTSLNGHILEKALRRSLRS